MNSDIFLAHSAPRYLRPTQPQPSPTINYVVLLAWIMAALVRLRTLELWVPCCALGPNDALTRIRYRSFMRLARDWPLSRPSPPARPQSSKSPRAAAENAASSFPVHIKSQVRAAFREHVSPCCMRRATSARSDTALRMQMCRHTRRWPRSCWLRRS